MLPTDDLMHLTTIEHGFKPFETAALNILQSNSTTYCKSLAINLIKNEHYQLRSVGVFLLGYISVQDNAVLEILKEKVSLDNSWQVQEILAKAFDQFCKENGYEHSLPVIEKWLNHSNPNVCRAVTEGLRIWTSRPFFNKNPEIAIQLISQHKAHTSEYLRKSVGNSLRDISKKYSNLIEQETAQWELSDKNILFTYKLIKK